MACTVVRNVDVDVALDTEGQTREKVMALVDEILRQNNAIECGIMARFAISLRNRSEEEVVSGPGAELAKLGVTYVKTVQTT